MKYVKLLLLGLGIYLLFMTIQGVGFETIAAKILELRWKLLALFVVYPFVFGFNALGWAYAFPSELPKRVPFRDLYHTRIIGETFNNIIPWTASLGGEPIKAELLKRKHGIPLSQTYASLFIVHTTFWVSLNLFVGTALFLTRHTQPLTPILWHSVLAFLIVLGVVALLLVTALLFGIFTRMHEWAKKVKWLPHATDKDSKLLQLDEDIKKFYFDDKRRLFLSSFFNFLSWTAGVVEVYLFMHILGLHVRWVEAWIFEALIQALRVGTFFIPASLGAQEGGIVLLFSQFGLGQPAGLAFAILRRIREIVWMGIGLILWAFVEDKPKLLERSKG